MIVYGGLAYRSEFSADVLALGVCHELGHLFGGTPFVDVYNEMAAEGQADYWAAKNCIFSSLTAFNYHDDNLSPKQSIIDLCQQHSQIQSDSNFDQSLCIRALKAAERLGAFFAHNAGILNDPLIETPDLSEVEETSFEHNSPQCRLDTFVAGLFKDSRPKCWFHD